MASRVVRVELTVRTALIGLGTAAAVWLFLQLWQILLVMIVALMLVGMLYLAGGALWQDRFQ